MKIVFTFHKMCINSSIIASYHFEGCTKLRQKFHWNCDCVKWFGSRLIIFCWWWRFEWFSGSLVGKFCGIFIEIVLKLHWQSWEKGRKIVNPLCFQLQSWIFLELSQLIWVIFCCLLSSKFIKMMVIKRKKFQKLCDLTAIMIRKVDLNIKVYYFSFV